MATLTPCLWVPGKAEEAAAFYLAAFRAAGQPAERCGAGSPMAVTVVLAGQEIMLFNPPGGPAPTPAISLFLSCATQAELDALWDGLLAGGAPSRCGWLTDRYSVSWQLVPTALGELMRAADAAQAGRLMRAIQGMVKLDVAALRQAFKG